MPHVASELSVFPARHHSVGPRSRAAEPQEGPSPFALLVETPELPQSPPPAAKDRGERSQASRASCAQESRADQCEQESDRPEPDDGANAAAPRSADAEVADSREASAAAADKDEEAETAETAKADTFEATVVAAAIGEGIAPPPAPIVAPVAIEAVLAAPAGGDESIDGAEAATVKAGARAAAPITLPEVADTSNISDTADTADTGNTGGTGDTADTADIADTADMPDIVVAPKGGTDQSAPGDRNGRESQRANVEEPVNKLNTAATAKSGEDRVPTESKPADVEKPVTVVGNATANGKKRAVTESSPVNASPRTADVEDAAQNDNHSKPTEPAASDDLPSAQADQHPNDHANAAKPHEVSNQPLGALVSEAAHGARPPSEAVHAILQAHGRAEGAPAPAAPTAPTATPEGLETAVPIAGLAVEIAARAQIGRSRFEIRLDPPELGRIDVRLDVDRSGQVTSRLVVDRVETLEYLRRDAADLERALQQAGLRTADNGLQFTLRDQSFAGRNDGGTLPNAAQLVVPDPELAPIDVSPAGYGRIRHAGGGIDIRV